MRCPSAYGRSPVKDPVKARTDNWRAARLAWAILAVLTFAIIVNVGMTAYELNTEGFSERPFDPWGEMPEQDVRNEGRALKVGDSLQVVGTKCIKGDAEIAVVGEVRWTSFNPQGASFLVGGGHSTLDHGCTTDEFVNPMPPEVVRTVEGDAGLVRTWRVTGSMWALDEHGHRSVEKTWETEEFTIHE